MKQIISTWGEMFSSSAVHTQTTALGEGIKQCIVGRSTITTITTRDWQVKNGQKINKMAKIIVFGVSEQYFFGVVI